jgi:phenylpropionate dioxygenase-like ring-hydroxylating dioxygenase large terminal subunit
MAELDHWHPVLLSRRLGRRPVGVRLAGRHLALFRTPAGAAALDDVCPHRRMRLSAGTVVGGRLQCPYHGWTFDACGHGESPGTPKLHACATSFEVREAHGAVWVRARGAETRFPAFDVAGYVPMCALEHRVRAPLDLVLDNFCEIEHTPTTHGLFGYDLGRMHEVAVRFEPTATTVRVVNAGPAKRLPWPLRALLGVGRDAHFHDTWTTHFSPVYSVYDHWWTDPATGRESKGRWRLYIFFRPLDDRETAITSFAYGKSSYPIGPAGGARLFRWLMRWKLDAEVRQDVRMLENLANTDCGIGGLKLSRFDRVLGLNRERLDRIYRGRPGRAVHLPFRAASESA